MKIKIFKSEDIAELEKQANEFLKDKDTINIRVDMDKTIFYVFVVYE